MKELYRRPVRVSPRVAAGEVACPACNAFPFLALFCFPPALTWTAAALQPCSCIFLVPKSLQLSELYRTGD